MESVAVSMKHESKDKLDGEYISYKCSIRFMFMPEAVRYTVREFVCVKGLSEMK